MVVAVVAVDPAVAVLAAASAVGLVVLSEAVVVAAVVVVPRVPSVSYTHLTLPTILLV